MSILIFRIAGTVHISTIITRKISGDVLYRGRDYLTAVLTTAALRKGAGLLIFMHLCSLWASVVDL